MESFITTNDLLKKTALPEILHQGGTQKRADAFLEVMQNQYSEDPQYKHLIESADTKDEPMEIENGIKNTRIAGYMERVLNWLRKHELRVLQGLYEDAKRLVHCRAAFY
jgi:hypothetical protein